MLSVPGTLKIFVATAPVGFRKSHDGLCAVVQQALQEDPLSGSLFVFTNKRADRLKLLYWDGDGRALWYKKFESNYPRFLLFTGIDESADNFADRPAAAGGMDSSPAKNSSRRCLMPGEIAIIVPPRAHHFAGQ